MKDWLSRIENEAQERAEEFEQRIRESEYGLLKTIGLELLPVVWGACWGGFGRAIGEDFVTAIPPILGLKDIPNNSLRNYVRGLIGYGFGVALAHSDKIF